MLTVLVHSVIAKALGRRLARRAAPAHPRDHPCARRTASLRQRRADVAAKIAAESH
jgi:hypothetical protein